MEPEGSLPCSQQPATDPYMGQINLLHIPSHFFKIHFNIFLPSMPGSSNWSLFPYVFPPTPCMHLSSRPYVQHAPPISHCNFITLIAFGKENRIQYILYPQPADGSSRDATTEMEK